MVHPREIFSIIDTVDVLVPILHGPPLSFSWSFLFLNHYVYMVNCGRVNLTALSPYQALQEQLTSVVQEIGHLIDPIATAARGEAAQLGHKVMSPGGDTLLRVCVSDEGVGGVGLVTDPLRMSFHLESKQKLE